ncbi:hypothetical protein [Streptomyces sp. B27]|uniref:hypothetical protein n=1 Tax=Streptomyces sp. B27 TaxID=2485015 RepID=UPI0013E3135D|nr:hypothetical protein [Streptomyces sp. B27]
MTEIHDFQDLTDAVYTLALLPAAFSRKRVQNMFDHAARTTEASGGRPRPYSVVL